MLRYGFGKTLSRKPPPLCAKILQCGRNRGTTFSVTGTSQINLQLYSFSREMTRKRGATPKKLPRPCSRSSFFLVCWTKSVCPRESRLLAAARLNRQDGQATSAYRAQDHQQRQRQVISGGGDGRQRRCRLGGSRGRCRRRGGRRCRRGG